MALKTRCPQAGSRLLGCLTVYHPESDLFGSFSLLFFIPAQWLMSSYQGPLEPGATIKNSVHFDPS